MTSKVVISNRIYISGLTDSERKNITSTLTYKVRRDIGNVEFTPMETIRNYSNLPKGVLSIPQCRLDLIPSRHEIVDKRVLVPVSFPEPKYPLFEAQLPVYEEINDSAMINALVGWGKSFTALYLAKKFGQKTLIVTPTVGIRDQWEENIGELFGLSCGIIGSGNFHFKEYELTVANIQTLNKHAKNLGKEFGTVILDECHHTPASTFGKVLDHSHARYKLGLSGTLKRKDNKHVIFQDYFGHHIVRPPQSNTMTPKVFIVHSGISLKPGVPWVERMRILSIDVEYQRMIAKLAIAKMAEGHSVLVISDRIAFLTAVGKMIGPKCEVVTGEIGDRKEAKRRILEGEISCIVGAKAIFVEGLSINILSCVILATPMNNDSLLEQIIGRIQRKHEGKLNPQVIDIQFSGYADKRQNNSRLGFYLRKGWEVTTT